MVVEPIVMAARRPRPGAEAAATALEPTPVETEVATAEPSEVRATAESVEAPSAAPPVRRAARIVATASPTTDSARVQRERLLARLLASEGRAMISRAADECRRGGVEFPLEQAVQLQLLEHVDETLARAAMAALVELFAVEAPLKRPILEQRLRRLEECADEEATRSAAAELRRSLRA